MIVFTRKQTAKDPRQMPRNAFEAAADMIDPPGRAWRRDPVRWATERAGLELWSKQREILESVRDHSQTAVASCHEVGKSFSAAVVTAWWIDTHPPGEAFVVTTAPTDKQVKAILWREINRLHSRLGLQGRTNLTEWYIGNEMVAFGRKPADYDPTAFQGIHSRYFLVVLDEACGIPKELWDAASSLAANIHGKVFAIGNPDDEHSQFADNCLRDPDWHTIYIGYEDTPNFTNENVSESLKEMLISRRWVEERQRKWGEKSAIFISKCKGRFPVGSSPYVVIPYTMAETCRWIDLPAIGQAIGGLDIGAGGDRTIIRERIGMKAGREAVFVNPDPMQTVAQLVEKINEWGLVKVNYDPIGVGWALGGRLKELSSIHNPVSKDVTHSAEIIPVNVAQESSDPVRFLNKRAELWWRGRELSRLGLWDLEIVDDDTLQELTTPLYELMDSKGKIKIQPKDEIIKVLGRSPDSAEALLLAFWETFSEVSMPKQDLSDYDLAQNLTPDW